MEKPTAMSTSTSARESGETFPPQEFRRRSQHPVTTAHFAGRLGGNQEFIADRNDDETRTLFRRHPDAAPLTTLSQSLNLRGFLAPDLWRMAIAEGWGTFLLVCLFGTISSGLTTLGMSTMANALYASVGSFVGLTLFTYALGPVSGAHLNPTITMATFFAGLSTFPRTVLYIVAQTLGGLVAGYWLKLGLGDAYYPKGVIPGCTVDPELVGPGELFVLEYLFCQALIFLAFGIGLDPRQGKTIGPTLAPLLVGLILAFGTFASVVARPGYSGMSFNPARCLGMMTAKGDMQYHYIHWLGPLAATLFHGLFYHFNPPWAGQQPLFGKTLAFFGIWHSASESEV